MPGTVNALEEELRIHAIELELQNEELQGSRARLESSQDEFRRLFELAPIGYLVLDESGSIAQANRMARAMFGAELINRRLSRWIKVQQRAEFERLLADLGDSLRAGEYELIDGVTQGERCIMRLQAIRLSTSPSCVLVCVEDISALKAAIARAEDSERSRRELIESSPDAMAVVRDGRIQLANAALRELLSAAGVQVAVGSSLVECFRPEERPSLEAALLVALYRGSAGYLQLHLDGSHVSVEVRLAPLNYDGQASVVVVARDITERLRTAAELEQSSRLASLGLLVAGVAHEINNPLAFVLPSLDDAIERLASIPPDMMLGIGTVGDVTELIADARTGIDRVAAIVKDLKVFHRVKESLELVDLNQVVVDTLKMAVPKLGHRVAVTRDLGRMAPIRGNTGRLGQIVLNLLLNASQSMPEGRSRDLNLLQVRTWQRDGCIHLEVRDNGVGIEEADLKKLFDPFFSKRRGGTGLGLTVCASLVREMGGWIEVDSQVGRWTRFVLRFPEAETQVVPAALPPVRYAKPNGLRLLIVDDEPLIFRTIRRLLGKRSALTQAQSGNDAISQLARGLEVDGVLTDLVMPNGTGLDLYHWIHRHRPALSNRVIFMTGMAHPENIGELPNLPQLHKPFSMVQIEDALARMIASASSIDMQRR